jgi:amino acid transporter
MRFTHGGMSRSFLVPFGPWLVPVVGILLCILLLVNTSGGTAIRFVIWLAVGHIVYFSYGFWHSKGRLQKRQDSCASMNKIVATEVFVISDTPEADLDSEIIEEETRL